VVCSTFNFNEKVALSAGFNTIYGQIRRGLLFWPTLCRRTVFLIIGRSSHCRGSKLANGVDRIAHDASSTQLPPTESCLKVVVRVSKCIHCVIYRNSAPVWMENISGRPRYIVCSDGQITNHTDLSAQSQICGQTDLNLSAKSQIESRSTSPNHESFRCNSQNQISNHNKHS